MNGLISLDAIARHLKLKRHILDNWIYRQRGKEELKPLEPILPPPVRVGRFCLYHLDDIEKFKAHYDYLLMRRGEIKEKPPTQDIEKIKEDTKNIKRYRIGIALREPLPDIPEIQHQNLAKIYARESREAELPPNLVVYKLYTNLRGTSADIEFLESMIGKTKREEKYLQFEIDYIKKYRITRIDYITGILFKDETDQLRVKKYFDAKI